MEEYVAKYPIDQVPSNGFGIAHIGFNSGVLAPMFYLVDEKYYPPYSGCHLDLDVASGVKAPVLHVYQPCNHTAYQYKIDSWDNPASLHLTMMHTVVGATYVLHCRTSIDSPIDRHRLSDKRAHLVVNGSFAIDFTAERANNSAVDIGYLQPLASTIKIGLAPNGWNADPPLND